MQGCGSDHPRREIQIRIGVSFTIPDGSESEFLLQFRTDPIRSFFYNSGRIRIGVAFYNSGRIRFGVSYSIPDGSESEFLLYNSGRIRIGVSFFNSGRIRIGVSYSIPDGSECTTLHQCKPVKLSAVICIA